MSPTRVLILGVLLDGPLHGYEVRKRLESWGAAFWANVAYGSIYHALSKMASEGLLDATEGDGKTVYALTDAGRAEFHRLLTAYWEQVMPIIDPFQVALTFMDRLPTADLLAAMQTRAAYLRAGAAAFEQTVQAKRHGGAPRHIDECMWLIAAQYRAQREWLEDAAARVEAGELP